MVSFTGSTRAGIEVARNAAATVKRVHQELGGKSPNIILDGPQFDDAVKAGVRSVFVNSGQSCNAPTRMLVPEARKNDAIGIAKAVAAKCIVGDPRGNAHMGPVVSEAQWQKIQSLIAEGIREGATLVAGGLGRPDGLTRGYFVKPTVFADVTNEMTIARTEIFGPVLSILSYKTIDDAVQIANDTEYGLAAYVSGPDESVLHAVSRGLRAGQINLNSSSRDPSAPFGGYKMSGNGREWGDHGLAEYLEVKAVLGAYAKDRGGDA
jgi:aldehyde dehydrogenase (NAD+)